MRNFKKVMAVAISTAAICTSVSAFAELEYNVTGDLTGSYDKAANSLTLTVEGVEDAAGDKTVLVLGNGVEATAATGDDILYINQYAEGEEAYSEMGLKGETALAAGTYAIKVGYADDNGDFAIAEGTLVVSEKQIEEPDVPQFVTIELWGDINSDGKVSVLDPSAIVSKLLGTPEVTEILVGDVVPGTEVIWGDINSDGKVSVLDPSAIVSMLLGSPEETEYIVGQPAQLPKVSE